MRFLAWTAIVGLLAVVGCGTHTVANVATTSSTTSTPSSVATVTPSTQPDPSPSKSNNEDATRAIAVGKSIAKVVKQGAPPTPIPTPGTKDWHATKLNPLELAKSIDNAFYHLHGGVADIKVHFVLPVGSGYTIGSGKFPEDAKFSVKFPIIEGDPPHPQLIEVRGNGGRYVMVHPGRGEKSQAYSQVRPFEPGGSLNGEDVLRNWTEDMPRLSMSHFITGKDVYEPLVLALSSPGSGYKVTSEEREETVNGRTIKDYRLVALRKAAPGNNNTESQIEIVVDGRKFVPVTMRTNLTPKTGKPTIIEWAGMWKGGKFDPNDFKLPG